MNPQQQSQRLRMDSSLSHRGGGGLKFSWTWVTCLIDWQIEWIDDATCTKSSDRSLSICQCTLLPKSSYEMDTTHTICSCRTSNQICPSLCKILYSVPLNPYITHFYLYFNQKINPTILSWKLRFQRTTCNKGLSGWLVLCAHNCASNWQKKPSCISGKVRMTISFISW